MVLTVSFKNLGDYSYRKEFAPQGLDYLMRKYSLSPLEQNNQIFEDCLP